MFDLNKALLLIIIWNIITFFLMKIDKSRAINGKRRISERALFTSAFFMGGLGIYMGMYTFRHKTQHWSFKILIPLAILFNLYLVYSFHRL